MNESPKPVKTTAEEDAQNRKEEIDIEKHTANYNITHAVERCHAGWCEESVAFSLIAISITLHGIWEIIQKEDVVISGGNQPNIDNIDLDGLKKLLEETE